MENLIKLIKQSKKPLIIAGGGIRLSRAHKEFTKMVYKLKIPVVVPLMGLDLLEYKNPFYMGHGGTKGQKSANIIIQSCDLMISIGSRLAIPFIGYNFEFFAQDAKKVVIDIDPVEHEKKTIKIDLFIKSDALDFIKELSKVLYTPPPAWSLFCKKIKTNFFTFKGTGLYPAIEKIYKLAHPNDVFIADAGITEYAATQLLKLKKGQRFIIPGGTLTMGYNLPAVIGVWATHPKGDIICIVGDGSLQLNIQELQTIVYHKIPVKIFVMNNQGYLAIRTTQKNFFKRFIGESAESGISFPSLKKVANAYEIKYTQDIRKAMNFKKTVICETICPKWQDHLHVKFGGPLNEMAP